uniref:condensin complex subunit 1-like n=1 Tax=Styela clava TaxID=7725 RepID=UPI00193AB72C|nr:condensin complex subunit 1-like [Styela clava]
MKNFVIPFHLQDLQNSTPSATQYVVEEVFSSRMLPIKLQNAKIAFARDGGLAVLENFDVIYSVVSKFNEIDPVVRQQTWEMLLKTCKSYSNFLGNILSSGSSGDNLASPTLDLDARLNHKNALKMLIYLMVQMTELFQAKYNQSTEASASVNAGKKRGKGSKNKTSTSQEIQWTNECEKLVRLLMTFVDLDIHRLWDPELVEDDFINLICNICYKILESQELFKTGDVKVPIFHVLGCLIKKFDQSMSASLKLVQLLQHFPHLSSPLAEAVSLWQNTFKCKTIVSGVLREISHIPDQEFLRDTDSTRNIGTFLVDLTKGSPSAVLANFSLMLDRMNEESYAMRNTVLSMMGEIVLRNLTGEELDEKAKSVRDQFLDYMYDHANLDPNAFTRSKSLQIWISLVKEQALPIKRYPDLVELCSSLLLDKSNLVRRFTTQLLETILRFNPFASELPIDVLQAGYNDAKLKLEQLIKEEESAGKEKSGDAQTSQDDETEKNDEEDSEKTDTNDVFVDEVPESNNSQEENKTENPEITKQKEIVNYLSNSVRFACQFHTCIPVLCELLRSRVHSDIIETISFFTAACQFKLSSAFIGVTAMLQQIWHEEPKIREAVVSAYKQLYFTPEATTARARASLITDSLMTLMSVSTEGKIKSIEALLNHLSKSGDIPDGVAQILWDRFTKPELNNSSSVNILGSYEQQKLAVQLLGFLAGTNPSIVKNNIDVLVTHGLKKVLSDFPEDISHTIDYSLALYTTRTLAQLRTKQALAGKYKKSMRLPQSHDIFTCLQQMIVKGYKFHSDNWEHFTSETIALIYDLSENPDKLCETIIHEVLSIISENANCDEILKKEMLMTRFYLICGQITIKQLVYLEVSVQSELKQRRKLKDEKEHAEKKKKENQEKKKNKRKSLGDAKSESNLEEDMGVGGATADDVEQEFIRNITENELLAKDNLLGLLAPTLVRACLAPIHADQQGEVAIQATASLALAKYMQVSSKFCEDHLQLLFTLLEKSPHEVVRANLVIPIGDLCVRFPNLLEPWTAHLYARLKDESPLVRIYAVKVLSNLILNDMVKVKGHVSEMARCTVDENERISSLVKKFFHELSTKGNSIYNVMPDIISRLSDPDVGVPDDEHFQTIMKFLFSFIHKDKQSESLVEKLCHRFSATRTRRQWQDLAFCLSLLSYSEKSIRKLQENFTCFADKLFDEQVYQCFAGIINKSKKIAKPEVKVQVDELEVLIDECHQKGVSDDQTAAKAAAVVKKSRRISSIRSPRNVIAWPAKSPLPKEGFPGVAAKPAQTGRKKRTVRSSSEEESDDDLNSSGGEQETQQNAESRPARVTRRAVRRSTRTETRVVINFSSDDEADDDNEEIEDDVKENIAVVEPPAVDLEEASDIDSQNSTPIRRKKTPKRRMTRSMLRA